MVKPQQPEIARSDRGEVTPTPPKMRRGGPTAETPAPGPVPEANQPGHHPEQDQDKPDVTPRRRPRGVRGAATAAVTATAERSGGGSGGGRDGAGEAGDDGQGATTGEFRFGFDPRFLPAALPFGITPMTARVRVTETQLDVRFGAWALRTPLDNVASVEVTGPYSLPKVLGPARLSLADRGITFATNARRGLCISFRHPVPARMPFLRHPALTVTVEEPERLAALLRDRLEGRERSPR